MKKALLAVLLVAGCSSGGSQSNQMTESDFEMKIATAIAYDPALLRTGDRVVYLVKRTGEDSQKYSWTAVAAEGTSVWVENNVPFEFRRMVSKTKLDRSGKVLEQWVGEPGGVPGKRYTAGPGDAPKPVRDSSAATADSKEEPDRITVGGKTYDCTRVTTVLSYPDKRKSTMINWFSKEVPFAATNTLGGLVKRQFGRLNMELLKGDHEGQAELLIPK
ncbi:MAG: hypothetical protein HY293_08630 [Planctomycetes bacterium]|nr:hypothetical protein [Planctomycetota bacterium]